MTQSVTDRRTERATTRLDAVRRSPRAARRARSVRTRAERAAERRGRARRGADASRATASTLDEACTPTTASTHAVQGVDARLRGQPRDGDDRAVGLRQVDARALHQPHARGDPRRARRGQGHCSTSVDIYDDDVDVVAVRRAIGMVFQKPNPFPTMSIFDNVAAGLRLTGRSAATCKRPRRAVAARRRPVGRGQGPPRRARASGSPAASSSGSASRARSPSSPR